DVRQVVRRHLRVVIARPLADGAHGGGAGEVAGERDDEVPLFHRLQRAERGLGAEVAPVPAGAVGLGDHCLVGGHPESAAAGTGPGEAAVAVPVLPRTAAFGAVAVVELWALREE